MANGFVTPRKPRSPCSTSSTIPTYAGVIAFDSEPYVLGHMRPLGEDRDELLGRVSRLEPGGGTDFKEALEIAEREILATGLPVREVILLTDGDTNRQYHDHDQLMADFAKQDIPVSTIRIGPDLENLRLLQDFAHNSGGDVLSRRGHQKVAAVAGPFDPRSAELQTP